MKNKLLWMFLGSLLIVTGCTTSTKEDTVVPTVFTEKEQEIAKLGFNYLYGFDFNELGKAEVRINLLHKGEVIQHYYSVFSTEKSPLNHLYVGFNREPYKNLFYNLTFQTSVIEGSSTHTVIDFNPSFTDMAIDNSSVSFIPYQSEKIDMNNKINILGAIGLNVPGIVGNVDFSIFDTTDVQSIEEIYERLENDGNFTYCYLIELHQE